jgi:hypothetical protein
VIRLLKANVVLESFTVETRPSRRLLFEDDEADGLDALLRSHNCTLRTLVQRVANPIWDDDPQGRTSAQGRMGRRIGRRRRDAPTGPRHGGPAVGAGDDPAVQRLPHPRVPVPPSPPGLAWGGGRPPWWRRRQRTRGGGPKVVRTCKGGVVASEATEVLWWLVGAFTFHVGSHPAVAVPNLTVLLL